MGEIEAKNAFWETYCYIKGDTGVTGLGLSRLVIGRTERKDFCILSKDQVLETKAVVPQNLGRYLPLCEEFDDKGKCINGFSCLKGHAVGTRKNIDSTEADENLLILDRYGKSVFAASPREANDTLGLRVGCYLKKTKQFHHTKLYLCEDYTLRTCTRAEACPYIHVSPDFLQPKFYEEYPPDIKGEHTILEAFHKLEEPTPQHNDFAARLSSEGLHKVRDLNKLSNEVFGYLEEVYGEADKDKALFDLLAQVRLLPQELSVQGALKKFEATTTATQMELSYLQSQSIVNMEDLARLKFRTLLTMPISSALKSCLQLMRERINPKDENIPFEVIDLRDNNTPVPTYVRCVVDRMKGFHESLHGSWRKSAKSQMVISAITYVKDCRCEVGSRKKIMTPVKPPSARFMPYPQLSPSLSPCSPPKDTMGGKFTYEWCSCPREVVHSINYELSTPSGSRCSEQNGLGKIASSGMPTSCIREVFVRGLAQDGYPDPNPLFPCGVCENMFRKLSRDVFQVHRADIMLYMYDTQDEPVKLIRLPFSEISNRASKKFKTFLDTEIRNST
eukprot:TRINITY_DN16963_c0_g1_i1.p1 TRINITY_DN16963_c0_g1~~TRINITY_DN16963_c0_g1_i1.p1  ORF type:complete len:575 (+),score=68.92 TRINITY_DN16963_c0_g1_i1:44-1726(+)